MAGQRQVQIRLRADTAAFRRSLRAARSAVNKFRRSMRWRGPFADDLAFRVRFRVGERVIRLLPPHRLITSAEGTIWTGWHVRRRERGGQLRAAFPLGGWYRAMCKLGLHFLHEDFVGWRWSCSCGRNFMNCEELPYG